jgi:hypothetical protein
MRILSLLCLLFIICNGAQSQTLKQGIAKDTNFYYYGLDANQLAYIKKVGSVTDTNYLFTKLVKTFNKEFTSIKDSLPFGSFIQVSIIENKIYYHLHTNAPFVFNYKKIDKDIFIYLKQENINDPNNKPIIANAIVKCDNVQLPYDSGYGGYVFPAKFFETKETVKNLSINYQNKDYLFILSKINDDKPNTRRVPKRFDRSIHGYMITDKPLYKPLDTLRMKAYSLDSKGKAMKQKAILRLIDLNNSKTIFIKKIANASKGAYLFTMQIPDTLKTDRTYQLQLSFGTEYNVQSCNFRIEDYLLNKSVMNLQLDKPSYNAGEDIHLKITTTDANGFPLNDVRLKYKLSIQTVSALFKDTLMLTATKKDSLIVVDTLLPYEKEHTITIRQKDLPPISGNYLLTASIIDAQFEKKELTTTFNYNATPYKFIFKQVQDSLIGNAFYNNNDTSNTFIVKFRNASSKLLDSVQLTTPFKFPLKANYTNAAVYIKDSLIWQQTIMYNQLDLVKCIGKRGAREINISFKYPFEEAVHYKIYKGDKLLTQGCKKNIDFKTTDSTLDAYKILITTNLRGSIETNSYWCYFYPLNKKLNIVHTLPKDAFPGQTIPVEFAVTDFYGNPVSDINIASYGVNTMFESNLSTPYIAVPEVYKKSFEVVSLPNRYDRLLLTYLNHSGVFFITTHHIAKYNLFKNEYYQLLYPKNGYQIIKNKKQQPTPELAVYCTRKGLPYIPKYVKANNKLLYLTGISNANQYSYVMQPGTYNLKVRMFDQLIEVPQVKLDSFNKHYIVINLDSLNFRMPSTAKIIQDSLTAFEPTLTEQEEIKNSLILFANLYVDSALFIANDAYNKANSFYSANYLSSIRIDDDNYNALLPYDVSQVQIQNGRVRHSLSIGKQFYYYLADKREFITKPLKSNAAYNFTFNEVQANTGLITFQRERDTLATPPQQPINQTVTRNEPEKRRFNVNAYSHGIEYQQPDSIATIQIFNSNRNRITNCWVISNAEPLKSIFASSFYQNIIYTNNAYASVDIYLFFENEKLCILKNIVAEKNSVLYINADSIKNYSYKEQDLSQALSIYNRIMQVAFSPFYDTPEELKDIKLENASIKNLSQYAYISGNIVDEGLSPINDVLIYFEQNGRFIKGATTNSKGEFELLTLKAGVYDIKIFEAKHQIKYYYQVSIGGIYGQYFTAILKNRTDARPYLETFNNNFKYAGYISKGDTNNLNIEIFGLVNKQPINNSNLILKYKDNGELKLKVANNQVKLSHKQLQNCTSLTIEAIGFNSIELCGIPTKNEEFEYFFLQKLELNLNLNTNKIERYRLTPERRMILNATNAGIVPPIYEYSNNNTPILSKTLESLSGGNVLDAAKIGSTVYMAKSGTGLSLGGGRTANSIYIIDGITVRDVSRADMFDASVDKEEYVNESLLDKEFKTEEDLSNQFDSTAYEPSLMSKFLATNPSNQYRKNFSDVAYWQPNLITDKLGKAYCNITLPDNITSWKNYTLAMGEQFYYAQAESFLKVYKPLQTITYTPSFLRIGDSVVCKAKFTNLLDDNKTVDLFFDINNKVIKKSFNLKTFTNDSIGFKVNNLSPIQFIAGLKWQDKYTDAEQVTIPVFNNAITQYNYQSILAEEDSTYQLKFSEKTKGIITFNNNMYERILQYTTDLENYSYGCVEQTASKLRALVYQQQIYQKLNKPVNNQSKIRKMIIKLEDMQNNNGSFGWWRKGETDMRMTVYALEALMIAQQNGYANVAVEYALNFLNKHLKKASPQDQLYVLYTLHKFNLKTIDVNDIKGYDQMSLALTDKMYYLKLKLAAGQTVDPNDFYAMSLELENNARNPIYDNFFYDSRANLFNAYQIFKGTSFESQMKTNFMKQILNGSLDKSLNTFSKAALIALLLEEANAEKHNKVVAKVFVNDTTEIKAYPFSMPIKSSIVNVKHSGAPVFIQAAEEISVDEPKIIDSLFKIETQLLQNNLATSTLKRTATSSTLQINIDAFKTKTYVMITIPLPAGIVIKNKQQVLGGQDYMEYHKDKIIIFKTQLPQGKTTFNFPIQVIYSGNFTMPAAQASMMYYPFVNGNNGNVTIMIE